VELMIRADRSIMVDSVETALGYFRGLAHSIMHDRLILRNVCARWVPRELKYPEKMHRVDMSVLAISLIFCRWRNDAYQDYSWR
jgi:hypothetical protein